MYLQNMQVHQQLSLAIAKSDLKYVCGKLLGSGTHPRSWPFSHWGSTIAFETIRHLEASQQISLNLRWEPKIAAAARNGGKFFDGHGGQFKKVVKDFRGLLEATHAAYFPEERVAPEYDFLRDDLSVITDGNELLLTNITGHFMVGLPPDRGTDMRTWGPHLRALGYGIGELTSMLAPATLGELDRHRSEPNGKLSWWDGKIEEFVPSIFAGEFSAELAFPLVSINSSLQTAHRWARAECCTSCAAAALKHRFTVLYHALSSLAQLPSRKADLGPVAKDSIYLLVDTPQARTVISRPFRSLRNGWLHLGFADIADALPAYANILSPISAYTGMSVGEFADLVNKGIDETASRLNAWLSEPAGDGASFFDCLEPADFE